MTEDFKAYAAREMVLSEAKRKKGEDGLSILDLRKFILQMISMTRDKEMKKLLSGFHNILSRMESKKTSQKNLTVRNRKTKR